MKIHNLFLLLLFAGAAASCTKPEKVSVPFNMSCSVDGASLQAKASATTDQGIFTINGLQTSGKQSITLVIGGTDTGVYTLGQFASSTAAYKPDDGSTDNAYVTTVSGMASGTVHVTSVDDKAKTISGTFSFTAVRGVDNTQKKVTGGTFTNVGYTGSLPEPVNQFYTKLGPFDWVTGDVATTLTRGILGITATRTDGTAVGISLPVNTGPGTYDFDPISIYKAQYNKNGTLYQAQAGSITISQKTAHELVATFSFKATNNTNTSDVVIFTNGTMDVRF